MKANNFDDVINNIKHADWWLEETPGTHQIAEWAWRGFIDANKYFDKKHLSIGIFVYQNDFLSEFTPRNEKILQFLFIFNENLRDKDYLTKKILPWRKNIDRTINDGWNLINSLEKLSRAEAAEGYAQFISGLSDLGAIAAALECVDPFTENELPKILKENVNKINSHDLHKLLAIMSAPEVLSFMERERIDYLSSLLKVAANKNKAGLSKKFAQRLSKKYHWIATHYGEAISKTPEMFEKDFITDSKRPVNDIVKELQTLENKIRNLKKEKKKIIEKYKLSLKLISIFELIAYLGQQIDFRKKHAQQSTYILYKLLEDWSKRLNVPKELLGYTTYDELSQWVLNNKKISLNELKKRREFSVFIVRLLKCKRKMQFITGKPAKQIFNTILKTGKIEELSGNVASVPVKRISGKVSLVLNTSTDKFSEGDILVTTMTRPDFLPLMRKAKAIITDEGGLTCHAAIVSRELGIPCIIGTKFATRVLKNGDSVEMDLTDGSIKVVS